MLNASISRELKTWAMELSLSGDCPFALPTLQSGRVSVHYFKRYLTPTTLYLARKVLQPSQIILLVFDPAKLKPLDVSFAVESANRLLRDDDRLVLSTHPADPAHSHKTLGVVFIQVRSEMVAAAQKLKRTSYYKTRSTPAWL